VTGSGDLLRNRRLALVRATNDVGSIPKFVRERTGHKALRPVKIAPGSGQARRPSPGPFRRACLVLGASGKREIDAPKLM